jgi:hypothetical protein
VILLSLGLLGFAVADLLRWSPEPVSRCRTWVATVGATGMTAAIAAVVGLGATDVAIVGTITIAVLAVWLHFDRPLLGRCGPGYPLAWIASVLVVLFALSGSADPVEGPLQTWYSNLAFPFARPVGIDQFVLGVSAGLFLLSSSNRIVRLVLEAAGTPATTSETTLRGGRLLGPMERLIVAAMVLSGDPAGAAFVIAAKGLLRLPEIRSSADQGKGKGDQVTEYFLVGTFSSLLLAAGMGVLISASG